MFQRYFPIRDWASRYDRDTLTSDLIAAVIVTIMLIPQSLAYALLAGLPAEVGLYASIAPLLIYMVFGTSMTLAVGPVAVASLMTVSAVGELAAAGTPEYVGAAILLALISGLMLVAMGVARLGFLANFLSHPVISGFITASAIIIAVGQLKNLFGVPVEGHTLVQQIQSLMVHIGEVNLWTLGIGVATIGFLVWARKRLSAVLVGFGLSGKLAGSLSKAAPVVAVIVSIQIGRAHV